MALVRKRNNPFACLGNSIPDDAPSHYGKPERRHMVNTSTSFSCMQSEEEPNIQVPPPIDTTMTSFQFPSLSTASKELVRPNPCTSTFESRDYQFVFRSKPIAESCPFEPYKVLLFIASAEGYHHSNIKNAVNMEDPRLSENGVVQCKKVSNALRKSKQQRPDIMYCSTMYRALSTMQLVCPEWYDDVETIALDELRPQTGEFNASKRSDANLLSADFRKVSFDNLTQDTDPLWNDIGPESEDAVLYRIHEFITEYLIPNDELVRTQYGTARPDRLENVGFKSVKSSPPPKGGFRSRSPTPNCTPTVDADLSYLKRAVVVSHRAFFTFLLGSVVQDVSPGLCKEWKHGDIRKVFVYTKQQLGMAPVPHIQNRMTLRHKLITQRSLKGLGCAPRKKMPMRRSKTPTAPPTQRQQSNSMSTHFPFGGGRQIASTSRGDILMTSTDKFQSHRFTLTSMSAALMSQHTGNEVGQFMPVLSMKSQSEKPPKSRSFRKKGWKQNYDEDEDEKEEERRRFDSLKHVRSATTPTVPTCFRNENVTNNLKPQISRIVVTPPVTPSIAKENKKNVKKKCNKIEHEPYGGKEM